MRFYVAGTFLFLFIAPFFGAFGNKKIIIKNAEPKKTINLLISPSELFSVSQRRLVKWSLFLYLFFLSFPHDYSVINM